MTEPADIQLTTNIAVIPGVGQRRAAAFRRIGIRCVADLLLHLPARYEHEHGQKTIADASDLVGPIHKAEANIAARGEVLATRITQGRRPRFEATLYDETGSMLLTWFNAPWMRHKLKPGMHIHVTGKAQRYGDTLQLVNPNWEPISPDEPAGNAGERLRPVYPASEDLKSSQIEHAVDAILEPALALLDDHLPADFLKDKSMPSLASAYRMAHRPEHEEEPKQGRRRLAYDELLLHQLAVMIKRRMRHELLHAPALNWNEAIHDHILARLPFELTEHQVGAIEEIRADLGSSKPMNRLLQGDVGAGKTAVALYAMLLAVASRQQAAMMAPTELLAEQHLASIRAMLTGSDVRIELLTGSVKTAARRELLAAAEAGRIDILIGTHALLTEQVTFQSLALAVIDEQHRFGVHQRAGLRSKAGDEQSAPHMLVMTATPIPRTLSLTVFGDLDVSTIRGLPPGRQPIITRVVPRDQSDSVYEFVAERLSAREQAYIVVPAIDSSESGFVDVQSHIKRLREGRLRGYRIEAMHGRLDRDSRDALMSEFRTGAIKALVATTVIEVGIDVPNATIMVIEQADRFGLAQLHQLRGRIGRGDRKSLCVLIADPVTEDGQARVDAIKATTDGFAIAEKDLEIRGPGEFFGARQAGSASFRVADVVNDLQLLSMARRDAEEWIRENPELEGDALALLRRRLFKAHGEWFGLGDVA